MADAEDGYDDAFDIEDTDEPLDLSKVISSLSTETDKSKPFSIPRFDGVTARFHHPIQILNDPLFSTGETWPDGLWDVDLQSRTGKNVLKSYFQGPVPPYIIIKSLQRVQNERVRTNFANIGSKMTYGFHGTPVENIDSIVKEGFKPGPGLMGTGVYIALRFQKANPYGLNDLGPDGEWQDKGNDRAMFLCTLRLSTVLDIGQSGLFTDMSSRGVNSVTRIYDGEREFMLYDPKRVRPMYLLRYRQLRPVMMTDEQKTIATLKARLYHETSTLGMWANRSGVVQSAARFLADIADLGIRQEMYKVLLNFIRSPKLFLVMNKVDSLIGAGKLEAKHKTFLQGETWHQYMAYTNLLDIVKRQPEGIKEYAGRYRFFELLKELANVAAKNATIPRDQQKRLRELLAKVIIKEEDPREVLYRYNRCSYIADALLPLLALMEDYYYTDQETYKRGLLKKTYQS